MALSTEVKCYDYFHLVAIETARKSTVEVNLSRLSPQVAKNEYLRTWEGQAGGIHTDKPFSQP